ncbi:hypothetical protein OG858_47080 (plasmid) [Streptomyces europaeiscabiei]|uniref:hypothetical protein n=1 Tax=Streptomyces europaeiscabiei TaxID=146819 RepID=UPI002E818C7B|nr:hypothetical protein [Streptomyces europaeiscabiei]WUD38872.1 hypothetical protein OG858_47080 [Streptomyces europaeiscabiei]
MNGELTTAIVAAVVSAGAAGVAVWQANIAKQSADSARIQADAAQVQADAAQEQVALMRRQIEAEDADRHQAAGPQFVIDQAHTDTRDGNTPYGVLVLRQESGPPLASVLVTASGEGVEGLRGEYASASDSYRCAAETDLGPMAEGNGTRVVHVALDYHHPETTVLLHLECRARDTDSVWRRSISSNVAPVPEPPRRNTSRSPWM